MFTFAYMWIMRAVDRSGQGWNGCGLDVTVLCPLLCVNIIKSRIVMSIAKRKPFYGFTIKGDSDEQEKNYRKGPGRIDLCCPYAALPVSGTVKGK